MYAFHKHLALLVALLWVHVTAISIHVQAEDTADKRPTKIWNRTGPLGETPKHVTDACPLSDQDNKGGWAKFEPMTDEFAGRELDPNKWNRGMYWWKGRQPALFSDKNVTVSDGKLHLTMRKEKLPVEAEKQGYKDYTSAALHTKVRSGYGYYEVKAKPMNSGGSSSFWFQQDEAPGWATEIDVFEIGGKAIGGDEMLKHAVQNGAGWRADCLGDMGGFSKNWCHMRMGYPKMLPRLADAVRRMGRRHPSPGKPVGTCESGWRKAARAAALRIEAKFRLSSWTTLAPCATASSSVRSVQRLMATMSFDLIGKRGGSGLDQLQGGRGGSFSSLRAGIRMEKRGIRQIPFRLRNSRHSHTMVPPPTHVSTDTYSPRFAAQKAYAEIEPLGAIAFSSDGHDSKPQANNATDATI